MSVGWTEISHAIQENPNKNAIGFASALASGSISNIPPEITVQWLPDGWTEDSSTTIMDPISLVLWIRDPMYRIAAQNIRRSMEMEEASSLLHAYESAWILLNGKSRGWIRKHLEEDLRSRASGGDPPIDTWNSIQTSKRAALLMDYICISKDIRVALWWKDTVTVIPFTSIAGKAIAFTQINCQTGKILLASDGSSTISQKSWQSLLLTKEANGYEWIPPACAPSLGSHTVAYIQSQILELGSDTPFDKCNRATLWKRLQWLTFIH